MRLTHGANGLGNNVIYQFNIDTFNTTSLKDGDVTWTSTNSPSIYKDGDRLAITFKNGGSQNLFNLDLTQFNIQTNFSVFLKSSISWGSFGITPEWGAYPRLSDYSTYSTRGHRVGSYAIEKLKLGYYTETVYGMLSILNRSKNNPWITQWDYIKLANGKYDVNLYWDNDFLCTVKEYDLTKKVNFTNNINGQSATQTIYIEELIIKTLP